MERGHGSASGIEFEAAVTILSAKCWIADTDGYPQQYDVPFLSPPEVAVMSMAMMIRGQGAWAALAGLSSNNATHIYVTVGEDHVPGIIEQQKYTTESIAYCSFESKGTIYLEIGS
jgi:hypothetical protein